MKLHIEEREDQEETEITILCRQMDENVLRVAAAIRALEQKLTGTRDGRTFLLEPQNIFYIESVDKRTFLYTGKEVYETPLRLYELEERYSGNDFFRAGKGTVINLSHVKMLNPLFDGRIEIILENNERQMVSRRYAHELRRKLGL